MTTRGMGRLRLRLEQSQSITFLSALCIFILLSSVDTTKTFDSHGCDVSANEFYCKNTNTCANDHNACAHGEALIHNDCSYIFSEAKLPFKYNLTSLVLPTSYYQIADKTVAASGNHLSILFNFCQQIQAPTTIPKVCKTATIGSGGEECGTQSAAFVYSEIVGKGNTCKRLSDCVDDGNRLTLELANPSRPAAGVSIIYRGGNTCPVGSSDMEALSNEVCTIKGQKDDNNYCARSLKVNLLCKNEVKEIPKIAAIEKAGTCGYVINLEHMSGCPTECPRSKIDGTVCSDNGVCFYDDQEDVSGIISEGLQCLCSAGYYGNVCEFRNSHFNATYVPVSWRVDKSLGWLDFFAATFIVTLFIVIILFFAIIWEPLVEHFPGILTCFGVLPQLGSWISSITSRRNYGYHRVPLYDSSVSLSKRQSVNEGPYDELADSPRESQGVHLGERRDSRILGTNAMSRDDMLAL